MPIFQHLACVVVDDSSDEVFGCIRSEVELIVLEMRCESIPMSASERVRDRRW
jgi:hypothetical protein